jgi:hypothetical protein
LSDEANEKPSPNDLDCALTNVRSNVTAVDSALLTTGRRDENQAVVGG